MPAPVSVPHQLHATTRQQEQRIAYLDGWRGAAIIAVLMGHFLLRLVPGVETMGGFGVELFFVLSGRLMADILFVSRHPLPDFFRRRFARIYPALLVYTLAMAALSLTAYVLRGKVPVHWWELASALTFTINYVQAVSGDGSTFLGHIWSVSVEEHCYVLLALLGILVSRRIDIARWVLLALGLLAVANGLRLTLSGAEGVHEVYWRTDVRMAPVFISAGLFLLLRAGGAGAPARRLPMWLSPACVAITALLFFTAPVAVTYAASAILLSLAINSLDSTYPAVLRFLSGRLMTTMGLLSYSIYLWQHPFFKLSQKVPGPLLIPFVLLVGAASFSLVERPARDWINGRRSRPFATAGDFEWLRVRRAQNA